MLIENKYLREWLDENYPMMKYFEDNLIELDFNDMDRFADWMVKKLSITAVGWRSEQLMPKCTVCNIMPKHPVLGANCKDNNCPHEH
jgi:hypothetical protein